MNFRLNGIKAFFKYGSDWRFDKWIDLVFYFLYTKEQKPIKWVRIHNLPDFAYFNHSQHVIVGKQKCQTCHGEVENIDYPMYQHADLTMGWCINCHRETEVQMEGNAYYDKVHEQLLEQYADKGIEKFTVEHIGGLECAKCHY
jgi:hypothetical protein